MFLVERIITVPTHLYLSEHKALYESWKVKPFVEIVVEDAASGCKNGYESLLHREWLGTIPLCLTKNKSGEKLDLSTFYDRND